MALIKKFTNKCLSLLRLGDRWFDKLIKRLIESARTHSYIETTSPSQADTLHLEIKQNNIKTFMHEYEKIVRFSLKKLKLKKVKIAFDTTEDLTWCKDNFNLRPSVYSHPTLCWNYLNVCIVEPYFLPLMSVPYRQVDDLTNLTIDLLKYVQTLPFTVDLALFDRGFYIGRLIDYMNNGMGKPIPYLMLAPKKSGKIKDFANNTRGIEYFNHKIKYSRDKSNWYIETKIITRRIDEKTCWCYATNQKVSLELLRQYGKRWNIETGFRIHDEAMIKSKSKNMNIRYFYHLLGMLLVILWRLQRKSGITVFKKYLRELEYYFCKEIFVPPPPPL